ncbi:hypothetical protein DAPPUDRAFT_228128 [Daphnia pulex]|uniref:Beta-hexosaminidase bacterial type N-terminal domain-containing protein n=1 Tax=Daphnia pulex TaxID=6669 RepID=E9HBA4_DAPPU|nr:hypothetical protein DAPPUDRAFT_228128 [Daphnia pulex]|eukprot:EFX70985.1 hypothetical protein DAPPUDRAFT_228128 [Daphnia pulex]
MKIDEDEASNSVKTSIEAHRTDVLKAVIDTIKKDWDEKEFLKFLNCSREDGTFLHLVTKNNQSDMVRLLLNYGADPTVVNTKGEKPLSAIADKHTRSAYKDALFASIASHDMGMMEKLYFSAIETDIRDNSEKLNTLLHWAVSFSNKEAIHFLTAVQAGNYDIVNLLIKMGADVNFLVQGTSHLKGKSAIDLAVPDSPLTDLLARSSKENSMSPKAPMEINGNVNGNIQQSYRVGPAGPASPGTESALSVDEIATSLPFIRTPIRPVITDARLHWLWPPPKQIQQLEGQPFQIHQPWNISFVACSIPLHDILDIWDVHKPQLALLGIDPTIGNVKPNNTEVTEENENKLTCCVKSQLFPSSESYRLTISPTKISIISSDRQGLHYALSTLEQLIVLCFDDGQLPPLHIEDSPSLRMRAILLDVSSAGRVPLLDSLFSMIDIWRSMKLNQIHLYSRVNTSGGSQWPWPYTKIEIISLDRYCTDRGMELVPALDVEGDCKEPRVLQELVVTSQACFPSTKLFHAGPGLTTLLAEANYELLNGSSPDITWLLCANSLREKQVQLNLNFGNILVEYGFQADYNFHDKSKSAWESSAALCFCAGTASWDSLIGYPDAASANILHAVHAAVERGALGSFVATWTDSVALGSLHFAWPGWILQAGLAWNHSIHWDYIQNSMGELVSLWVLNEPLNKRFSVGVAIVEMGRLETWLLRHARGELDLPNAFDSATIPPSLPPKEGSVHYRLLLDPDSVNVDSLNMECVVRTIRHTKKWHKLLTEATVVTEGRHYFMKTIALQALLSADFLLLACRILRGILTIGSNPNSNMGVAAINLGVANLTPTLRTDAANKMLSLTERFQQLWVQQYQNPSNGLNNIIGALNTSIQRLLANVDTSDL